MQKLLTFFFSKNISIYTIFNDQSFNDTLNNDIISFEQLGPVTCIYEPRQAEMCLQACAKCTD